MSLATGGISDNVLDVFAAQARVIGLGRDVISRLHGRLRGADRITRTRQLEAAFVVLTVTAYFEALAELDLPFPPAAPGLTRHDQIRLATGTAADLTDALIATAPLRPEPYVPHERLIADLTQWYRAISARLLDFVRGLAFWDALDETRRKPVERLIDADLAPAAAARFDELFLRLVNLARRHRWPVRERPGRCLSRRRRYPRAGDDRPASSTCPVLDRYREPRQGGMECCDVGCGGRGQSAGPDAAPIEPQMDARTNPGGLDRGESRQPAADAAEAT